MHRCLLVTELAIRIAEACALVSPDEDVPIYYLDDHHSRNLTGLDLRTVWALAQTCRALQDPGLDIMWRFQFGLQTLLRCMPYDLWEARTYFEDPEFYEHPHVELVGFLQQ